MPTSRNFSVIRGRVMRLTRLDSCGNRVLGPNSVVVSKGFISVTFTARVETGDAIAVTNANGETCISDAPAPRFAGYDIGIAFCGVNPDALNLVTGQPVVYDRSEVPVGVGFQMNSDVVPSDVAFALEVWSTVPTESCVDGQASYGYFLVPFVSGGVVGDFTIENAAVNFTLANSGTKDGNNWGTGPYNVVLDGAGSAGPLAAALSTKNHLHMELTQVAPPEPEEGAIAAGVPATGATAGIPATYTPANSYGPLDLADAADLTATPGTAWTTGQYIQLRDGTRAHWNGTGWAAGSAP